MVSCHTATTGQSAAPPLALYIHWPFCLSKCPYCDFNSHVQPDAPVARFEAALRAELRWVREQLGPRRLTSVFFGGGTPSLMRPEAVADLIADAHALFPTTDAVEITLEANPTSVETGKFRAFAEGGVSRVSIGIQSFIPEQLAFLGRQHSAAEAKMALGIAARFFPRYSFDLIYALPGQSPRAWETALREALSLAGGHLSLYQLTIEEHTAFHHAYHTDHAFVLPPETDAEIMYTHTQEMMTAAGMPAYEVSNHAAAGMASHHNLTYWRYGEYAGIGPGAHGRHHHAHAIVATRALKSPARWLEAVETQGHGMEACDPLPEAIVTEERLMMRLRLTEGVPLALLAHLEPTPKLALLEANGLLTRTAEAWVLTPRGRLVLTPLTAFLLKE